MCVCVYVLNFCFTIRAKRKIAADAFFRFFVLWSMHILTSTIRIRRRIMGSGDSHRFSFAGGSTTRIALQQRSNRRGKPCASSLLIALQTRRGVFPRYKAGFRVDLAFYVFAVLVLSLLEGSQFIYFYHREFHSLMLRAAWGWLG